MRWRPAIAMWAALAVAAMVAAYAAGAVTSPLRQTVSGDANPAPAASAEAVDAAPQEKKPANLAEAVGNNLKKSAVDGVKPAVTPPAQTQPGVPASSRDPLMGYALAAVVLLQLVLVLLIWPGSPLRAVFEGRKKYDKILTLLKKHHPDGPFDQRDWPKGRPSVEELLEQLAELHEQNYLVLFRKISDLEAQVGALTGRKPGQESSGPTHGGADTHSRQDRSETRPSARQETRPETRSETRQERRPDPVITRPAPPPAPPPPVDRHMARDLEVMAGAYRQVISSVTRPAFDDFVRRYEAVGLSGSASLHDAPGDFAVLIAVNVGENAYALLPGWDIITQFGAIYSAARAMPEEIQSAFDLQIDRRGVLDLIEPGLGERAGGAMRVSRRGRISGLSS